MIHRTSGQNIKADPALSQVTDALATTQTFLLYFNKTAHCSIFSDCYNRDMHFPTISSKTTKQAPGMLPEWAL